MNHANLVHTFCSKNILHFPASKAESENKKKKSKMNAGKRKTVSEHIEMSFGPRRARENQRRMFI